LKELPASLLRVEDERRRFLRGLCVQRRHCTVSQLTRPNLNPTGVCHICLHFKPQFSVAFGACLVVLGGLKVLSNKR
jgi:hypothetical protein